MKGSIRNGVVSAALGGAALAVLGLAAPPAVADGGMVVRDFMLSHGISQREPVDETRAFRIGDDRAFAFARIENRDAPREVSFVWYYGGEHHATVPMHVGISPGWRTWSTARLRPGHWRVELIDSAGRMLSARDFEVGQEPGGPVAMQDEWRQGGSDMGGMGRMGEGR